MNLDVKLGVKIYRIESTWENRSLLGVYDIKDGIKYLEEILGKSVNQIEIKKDGNCYRVDTYCIKLSLFEKESGIHVNGYLIGRKELESLIKGENLNLRILLNEGKLYTLIKFENDIRLGMIGKFGGQIFIIIDGLGLKYLSDLENIVDLSDERILSVLSSYVY